MCGRYVLNKPLKEITEFLNASSTLAEVSPNFNTAPTHEMPVAFTGETGARTVGLFHWGFMGWQPKHGSMPFFPINTRDDAIYSKPMWKKAFLEKRCIVPASGFYEWAGTKGNKTPHYIFSVSKPLMGMAGIYSDLAPGYSASQKSYSIITTSANKKMEKIHDRMPVILHPGEFDDWLNPANRDPAYLKDFLRPYPDDDLDAYIVSKAVGNVRNNEAGLIEKAGLF